MNRTRLIFFNSLLAVALLISACGGATEPTLSPTSTAVNNTPASSPTPPSSTTPTASPQPTATPTPQGPVRAALDASVPIRALAMPLSRALGTTQTSDGRTIEIVAAEESPTVMLQMQPAADAAGINGATTLSEWTFAVVAPFATVRDDITFDELKARWAGQGDGPLLVSSDLAPALAALLGAPPAAVAASENLLDDLNAQPGALGLLPFDQLDPTYKVLAVDGVNPLSNQFQPADYPLRVALVATGPDAENIAPIVASAIPATNRDPAKLTTLIMTGVTAMSRGTAEKMEEKGYLYPSLVISDTLKAADITHVSNEVPFIKDCPVNNTYMNLVLCSDYPYWQALEAIGTDIVGLSGNHVNDYGRDGARESLAFYRDRNIPIYGSGLNEDEACQPLRWEHNGNTFAFIAALAWWPEEAWATADEPGACYLYNNYDRILNLVRELSQEVDVVSVELQYYESYDLTPLPEQVREFRELRAAGADIVTGVQSHVPQAMETFGAGDAGGPGAIVYGLGNLFFDQMQDWDTRTGLITRHTIYDGRPLSTEILTTVLEDFAQPRWATPAERAELLQRVFDAAPPADANATSATGGSGGLLATQAPATVTPAPEPLVVVEPPAEAATPVADDEPSDAQWPAPASGPADHFLLARPIAADANQSPAPSYPFGGSAGGRYRIHHGVDIANATGTPVLSPARATVHYAGPDQPPHVFGPYPDFYGNVVVLRLDQTWEGQPVYVLFGHLNRVSVASGQRVELGQPVGQVGMTGIAIGPHLHQEVRLAGLDYDNVYQPALWTQPWPGYGVIAGQVVTPDGQPWHDGRVLVYRLDEGSQLLQVVPLYEEDPGIRPDPVWAENFALGDVPAGNYQLVLRLGDRILRQRLVVEAGRTSYARFVVAP